MEAFVVESSVVMEGLGSTHRRLGVRRAQSRVNLGPRPRFGEWEEGLPGAG